jgi:GT2 family glycosyltransferase
MLGNTDTDKTLVILVNWRRPSDTIACIRGLADLVGNFSVCVCENSSPDDSFALIYQGIASLGCEVVQESDSEAWFKSGAADPPVGFKEVLLTRARSNLGFAGGNNYAFERWIKVFGKDFKYVWFLNNDTEPDRSCLSFMLEKFNDSERVGIVGSTLVYYFDRKTVQAMGGSVYKAGTGLMHEIGNGAQWPCKVDEPWVTRQLSYVCGASMLVSRRFIEDVGLMQNDYFLFFEEIDWSMHARGAGYSLAYASQAVVYHKEGASIGSGVGAKRSLLAEYYGMRNKLLITWRFFPWAMPSVWLISWLQVVRRLMQQRPRHAWLMARILLGIGKSPV